MPGAGLFLSFDGVLHNAGIERMPAAGCRKAGPEHFEWAYDLLALLGPRRVPLAILSRWRLLREPYELLALMPHHLASRVAGVAVPDLPKPLAAAELASRLGWSSWASLESESGAFEPGSPRLILCDPSLGVNDPAARGRLADWLANLGPDA